MKTDFHPFALRGYPDENGKVAVVERDINGQPPLYPEEKAFEEKLLSAWGEREARRRAEAEQALITQILDEVEKSDNRNLDMEKIFERVASLPPIRSLWFRYE